MLREKDPDLDDCIINQKLHMFNIGVENSMIAVKKKRLKGEQVRQRKKND